MNSLKEVLKTVSQKELRSLHQNAMKACEDYRKSESLLIRALQAVDQYKVYRFLGYHSLFQYALQALGLSEHQSYTYITVSRKSLEVPALLQALENKEISITNAKRVSSVLTPDNQTHWIKLGAELNSRDLEKALATEFPNLRGPEHLKYINDHELEMKITIKEPTFKKLQRLKEIEKDTTSYEELIDKALSYYIEKKDPVKKAERKLNTQKPLVSKRVIPSQPTPKIIKLRKPLPAQTKHFIFNRSKGRCEHTRNNIRCEQRKFLEIHHIRPMSLDGSNDPTNLIHICSGHHKMIHGVSSG